MTLRGTAAGHGECGLDVAEGSQQLHTHVDKGIHQHGELTVGSQADDHVQTSQTRQLGADQRGGQTGPLTFVHSAGEVRVCQNGHVDLRIFGDGTGGVQTAGGIVDHQSIGAGIDGTVGTLSHGIQRAGDIEGIQGLLALDIVSLLQGLHNGLDTVGQAAERRIADQLVILNDVHAAHGSLIGQLGSLFRSQADAGLDHVIQQRTLGHTQQITDALYAELGALEVGQEGFGELQIHQLHLTGAGDVADDGGEHHGDLCAEVLPGVGDADNEVTLGHGIGNADLIGRRFVHTHHTADGTLTDFGSLAGHFQPGSTGLLDGQRRGKLHHVGSGLGGAVVGGDHKFFVIQALRHLVDNGVDKHKATLFHYCNSCSMGIF